MKSNLHRKKIKKVNKDMFTQQVKVRYFEPKMATITLETPNRLSGAEAEDMALAEFAEKYPEGQDPLVEEVTELN